MKADGTRNFEAGILTDDPKIVEQAMDQFDEVWMGKHCKTCKRKDFCPDPILAKENLVFVLFFRLYVANGSSSVNAKGKYLIF